MKTALYVAATASAYRRAIDDYFISEDLYRKNIPDYMREISMCTTREFTTGFYFRKPTEEDQIYTGNTYRQDAVFLGEAESVDPDGGIHISQKNKFTVGEEVQVMPFRGEAVSAKVLRIVNEEGGEQESAPHPKQALTVYLSGEAGMVKPGMMLRRVTVS